MNMLATGMWIIFHFAAIGDVREPVDSMMACQIAGQKLAEQWTEAHKLVHPGPLKGWSCQIGSAESRA